MINTTMFESYEETYVPWLSIVKLVSVYTYTLWLFNIAMEHGP